MMTGSCLCGHIQYEAAGDPDFPHLCSCEHCQRLSGSPVMSWVDFPADGFEWTGEGGEPTWFNTWPTTQRGFCGQCGSSIAARDEGGDIIGVTMTSLEDHSQLVPERQSFADNAVPWLPAVMPVDQT